MKGKSKALERRYNATPISFPGVRKEILAELTRRAESGRDPEAQDAVSNILARARQRGLQRYQETHPKQDRLPLKGGRGRTR